MHVVGQVGLGPLEKTGRCRSGESVDRGAKIIGGNEMGLGPGFGAGTQFDEQPGRTDNGPAVFSMAEQVEGNNGLGCVAEDHAASTVAGENAY